LSGDVIELLIYHQPGTGVKPSLTLRPFGVLGYVAGHSLTILLKFLSFQIYGKAQGCDSHYRMICTALTMKYVFNVHPDDKFRVARCGRDWIMRKCSPFFQVELLHPGCRYTGIVYGPLTNGVDHESALIYPLLGNGCKAQIDSILFCSHCPPDVAPTWRTACLGS
jgi:hypothetical protein